MTDLAEVRRMVRPLVWTRSSVFGVWKWRGSGPFGEYAAFTEASYYTEAQIAEMQREYDADYADRILSALDLDALTSLEEEIARLRREATDRSYMLEAYRSMLGPNGLAVAKMWDDNHVKRVHHDWTADGLKLSGEERAQEILAWETAPRVEVAGETR